MLLSFLRLLGAVAGFMFGFLLGVELLQITRVTPISDTVRAVYLMGVQGAILGWLGAPYVTIIPARYITRRIRETHFGDLAGGAAGAAIGLLLGALLVVPLSLLPGEFGRYVPVALAVLLGLVGGAAGVIKRRDLANLVRELRAGRRPADAGTGRILLDTSVVIDGRIADVVKAGFVRGTLLLPRFVLAELQLLADSGDSIRRERGRRGLEMLSRMRRESGVHVEVVDGEADATDADAKLVALARILGVPIMTNDYGLDRVAELQGVTVLNVNDLAKALRPVVLPGEELSLRLIQEGKEAGQGVGYLEDGTMVVVENAARSVGADIQVTVLRVLQTVGGRMIFAQVKGEPVPERRPRVVGH